MKDAIMIAGAPLLGIIQSAGSFKSEMEELLKKYGFENINPDEWYPVEAAFKLYEEIEKKVGRNMVIQIGKDIATNAILPPQIDSVDKVIMSLNAVFHANHRNYRGDEYVSEKIDDNTIKMVARIMGYPSAFHYGLIKGFAKKLNAIVDIEFNEDSEKQTFLIKIRDLSTQYNEVALRKKGQLLQGINLSVAILSVLSIASYFGGSYIVSSSAAKIVEGTSIIVLAGAVLFYILYLQRGLFMPMNKVGLGADKNLSMDDINQLVKGNSILAPMLVNIQTLTAKHIRVSSSSLECAEQLTSYSEELSVYTDQTKQNMMGMAKEVDKVALDIEHQLNTINESAIAMNEISMGIQRIAGSNQIVSEASAKASSEADKGHQLIQEVTEQMNMINDSVSNLYPIIEKLSERSQSIGQIVTVITEISNQTNLLALNAAIEAARAGENGKGFAVVADEVRKLADESNESAKQISEVIKQIQEDTSKAEHIMQGGVEDVHKGIEVVQDMGSAFQHILMATKDVTEQLMEMSAASEQLSASTEEVTASMDEITHIASKSKDYARNVSENAFSQIPALEEIYVFAESLATFSDQLINIIEKNN